MEIASDLIGNRQLEKIMFDIQDYYASPVEAAVEANKLMSKS